MLAASFRSPQIQTLLANCVIFISSLLPYPAMPLAAMRGFDKELIIIALLFALSKHSATISQGAKISFTLLSSSQRSLVSTLTKGLIKAIFSFKAAVFLIPKSFRKYCWRFRLLASTVSKSHKIIRPTPTRAKAIATDEPSPPSPAMPTQAFFKASFSSGVLREYIISRKSSPFGI